MADWRDVLDNIAAGASGVNTGLTKAADPFLAWDKVQAADQGIDKSALQLRDLTQMQDALENPDLNYYGNAAQARNTGNLKSTAAGNLDIFNNSNQLDLNQYLSDPNGLFQLKVRAQGLQPGSVEYRQALAEAIGSFNPQAGVTQYDKSNIPGIEQRNVNEQAALAYIQGHAQQLDPGAQVIRMPDGTVAVIGSDGSHTPVPADYLVKVAAMLQANTPDTAIQTGLKSEGAIQQLNINLLKALQTGNITPAQALKAVDGQRITAGRELQAAQNLYISTTKSSEYQQADDETKKQMVAPYLHGIQAARDKLGALDKTYQTIAATSRVPGAQSPGIPGPGPQGGSSVTTRPPPGSMAARAAGQSQAVPGSVEEVDPYGLGSGYGGDLVPQGAPQFGPAGRDTGIRPITQGVPADPLLNFLQSIGAV